MQTLLPAWHTRWSMLMSGNAAVTQCTRSPSCNKIDSCSRGRTSCVSRAQADCWSWCNNAKPRTDSLIMHIRIA